MKRALELQAVAGPAERMDRMYRFQRHFYDWTRKYYLIGRDRLIRDMPVRPGDHILEVGCGTAHNLIGLALMHPEAQFYGLDASRQMLDTAFRQVARHGLAKRVHLAAGLAEELDGRAPLGRNHHFDGIFFSYSLSMIPPWRSALDAAWAALRPGGFLHVLDFWDQRKLPRWFTVLLQRWLSLFGVRPVAEATHYLCAREEDPVEQFTLVPVFRRYAFIASFRKRAS
jgi:S-adenosylmethionine-diacylgycerolhomoserine-N-methlytransferase